MARAEKNQFIADMQGRLSGASGVLLIDYTGTTVENINAFRGKLRAAGLSYRVVKNTLMARAMKDTCSAGVPLLKGTPTGVIVAEDDIVAAAKVTIDFAKECDTIKLKGAVVEDKALAGQAAAALASMPSKRDLQGQVVALAQSPGANLAGQIKSASGRIVGAIEALVKRLSGE